MFKKSLMFGGITALGFFCYLFFSDKKQELKNFPPKNETILVFGDSLTAGYGATSGNDFPSLLGKNLQKTVLNFGVNGNTTHDALSRLDAATKEDPGMAIVILGANDFMQRLPEKETFGNLEKIVRTFQKKGAAVVLIGVRSDLLGDGKGGDYSLLAQKTGAFYVPDFLDGVFGNPRFMADPVHPNDAGYAQIADRIAPIIKKLYENKTN